MEILKINGQSMFPTLKHEDRVLVKKVLPSQIKPRDIIIFQKNYQTVCHRVKKMSKHSDNKVIFYTRGDFNFNSTEKIDEKGVLGKIIGVYRNGRLRSLNLEQSYIYYLFINIFSFIKEVLKQCIEKAYYFSSIRRLFRACLPIKVEYIIVNTENLDDDFNSLFNFPPLSKEQYDIVYKLFAKNRNKPVAKLWILEDKKGDILLYGPYVKLLYRGRNIGTGLVKKALDLICTKMNRGCVYASITTNKNVSNCFFKKFGFILDRNGDFPIGDPSVLKKVFS